MKPKTAIFILVIIFLAAGIFLSYFIFNPGILSQPGLLKPENKDAIKPILTDEEKRRAMLDLLKQMEGQTATKTPEESARIRQELLSTLDKMNGEEKSIKPSAVELEKQRQKMLEILNSMN